MSQTNTYSEQAVTTAYIKLSIAEKSFPTLPEAKERHVTFPLSLTTDNSLEAQLEADLNNFRFALSEAEAAFTSPVRHFFTPGGQQLVYNQN